MTVLRTQQRQKLWKAAANGEQPHGGCEERRGSLEGVPAPGSLTPTAPQQLGECSCGIQILLQEVIISHFGHGRARQSDSLLPALGTGCLQPSGCCFTKHGCLFGGLCSSFASRCQSARSAVFTFLTMFWGKKEKKGIFVRREEREVEQLFKTQVPLSKTLFPTVPQNKPNQMNFCPASFWLNHAMKIYALPILS